jgi:pilus assembly protein CpaB
MGKWKAMIPIALAFVVAASASMFTYKWLKKETAPKEVVIVKPESEAVPVAVAAVDLNWGTKLEPAMIKTVPYLKDSLPPGYTSNPESVKGRILVSQLKQNEPIVEYRLAPDSVTTGGVSAVLAHGKRALAVKGDKVIGISGFIRPGDRVDVIVTLQNPRTKKKRAKTVLENVMVLETGTELEKDEAGKPHSVDVYTLEVTPMEGEKLALAATEGKLQFALRNATDNETVLTWGATVPGTLAAFSPTVTKPKKRKPNSIQVIKGDKVSSMNVNR